MPNRHDELEWPRLGGTLESLPFLGVSSTSIDVPAPHPRQEHFVETVRIHRVDVLSHPAGACDVETIRSWWLVRLFRQVRQARSWSSSQTHLAQYSVCQHRHCFATGMLVLPTSGCATVEERFTNCAVSRYKVMTVNVLIGDSFVTAIGPRANCSRPGILVEVALSFDACDAGHLGVRSLLHAY
jgi:hypothetical protein